MLELFKSRRSTRKFTEKPLTKEQKDSLLKAGLLAPASKGNYPVQFVTVEQKETLQKLKDCKNFGTTALETAPLAVVVIGDRDKSDVWVEDCSIAATHLFLEAEKLGLGANWIQIRLRQSEKAGSEEEIRSLLQIPRNFGIVCIIAVGEKDEEKPPYTDDWYRFDKIHSEKF